MYVCVCEWSMYVVCVYVCVCVCVQDIRLFQMNEIDQRTEISTGIFVCFTLFDIGLV